MLSDGSKKYFKFVPTSVDVTKLIMEESDKSLHVLYKLKDSNIKMIFEKNQETVKDEKINKIIRLFIDPRIYKHEPDILLLPEDDEFYKKAFKLGAFKNIYFKLLNDFIFSTNTTDNSYFSTEIVDYKVYLVKL